MKNRQGRAVGCVFVAAVVLALAATPAAGGKGFLYSAGGQFVGINSIGADNTLTPVPPPADGTANGARGIAMTSDAKHLYYAGFSGTVSGFSVGANGGLTAVAGSPYTNDPVLAANDSAGIAVTPDDKFVYTASVNGGAGAISIYSIGAGGALTQVDADPGVGLNFLAGYGTYSVAVSPSGGHLYVTDSTNGSVHSYTIATTGLLTEVGTAQVVGAAPKGIVVSSSGSRLFAVSQTDDVVRSFPLANDGTIGAATSSASLDNPVTLSLSRDGRFLYAAQFTAAPGRVGAFAVGADGALTPVTGQPFTAADSVEAVDAAPNGAVYSGSFDGAASPLNQFAAGSDGALTPLAPAITTVPQVEFQGIVATPDQGPTAGISAVPGPAGTPTTFDAAGSVDNDGGTIQEFNWEFGDGDSQGSGGQTLTHVYQQPGTYTASVTVVDDGACSTTDIYTGQTADCNGNPAAKASIEVVVPPGTVVLKLSGKKKQPLDAAIEVAAKCDLDCKAAAKGNLIVITPSSKGGRQAAKSTKRSFKIKKVSKQLTAGVKKTLKLKLSKNARKAATKALGAGGKVTAKITVTATSGSGVKTTAKRSITLIKKR